MEKDVKSAVKHMLAGKAVRLIAEAAEILSTIEDGDMYEHAFSHAIMALTVLTPEAPMPTEIAATLKKYGLVPVSKVASHEELDKMYAEASLTCNCERCTARRNVAQWPTGPSTDTLQ